MRSIKNCAHQNLASNDATQSATRWESGKSTMPMPPTTPRTHQPRRNAQRFGSFSRVSIRRSWSIRSCSVASRDASIADVNDAISRLTATHVSLSSRTCSARCRPVVSAATRPAAAYRATCTSRLTMSESPRRRSGISMAVSLMRCPDAKMAPRIHSGRLISQVFDLAESVPASRHGRQAYFVRGVSKKNATGCIFLLTVVTRYDIV